MRYVVPVLVVLALVVVAVLLWPTHTADEPKTAPPVPSTSPSATASTTATPVPPTPSAHPGVVRFLTANVPFTLGNRVAREQIGHVLRPSADVVVVNEVLNRDVRRLAEQLQPGQWNVFQPTGKKADTAILWRRDRFTERRHGVHIGVPGPHYDRYLPWVVLREDTSGRAVTVIGLHFPTNASKLAGMRLRYLAMNASLAALVAKLTPLGHPIVAGGDWNHPLDKAREPWSPVPMLRSLRMTTNWRAGLPCRGTSSHLGKIDGFALDPGVKILRQGCLARAHSDHRPVWLDARLPSAP